MKTARAILLVAVAALVFGTVAGVSAGKIYGRYYHPCWSDYVDTIVAYPPGYKYYYETMFKGRGGVSVTATLEGNLIPGAYGAAETADGEPVGHYEMEVPTDFTRRYGVMFHEKNQWGPTILLNQAVTPTAAYLRLMPYIKYQDSAEGTAWDVFPAGTWSQSFVAKGTCVTQVGLHQTQEFGPNVQVYVTAGGPGPASQAIGPVRTVPTDVVDPSSVYWSAGEVPTIPGETYCVNLYVPTGFQVYMAGGRIQGGLIYPDGRAYRDYTPITGNVVTNWGAMPLDRLAVTIYQDTDGYIPVVNTSKYNKPRNTPLQLVTGCTVAGQTFVAKGTSLLSFSCRAQNTGHSGFTMQVTCYRSPGANGEGVNQVGVAKYMKQVPNQEWNRCGVVWKPGEVPLTEGESYYIKVKCVDNQPFDIMCTNENEYSNGAFFKNGNEMPYDLSTTITTEKFAGSMSQTKVRITNINVNRGTNSATVNWTTDVPTDTNYVEWGLTAPYTNKTDGASGGTSHSVTLTGLTPNMEYHYRVVSKTAGYRDNYSRDFVFVTDPDQPNLITNPGFESPLGTAWVPFTIYETGAGRRNFPWTMTGEPSWFGLQARPQGGNWFYGSATNGNSKNKGGLYQRVPATPGEVMALRAWVINYRTDPFSWKDSFDQSCLCRVGIDPNGGTDPQSSNIIWGPWILAQDVVGATEDGNGKGSWTEAYVQAAAASNYVTVFLIGGSELATRWDIWGFDDVVLTKSTAQDVARIKDLAGLPDGTLVRLADKIVTAGKNEDGKDYGANYIGELDRTAGVRVETETEYTRGNKVTVQGRKGTKGSGEVYIYDAILMSSVADTELGSLATQAQTVGKKIGPSNVGMLMSIAGRVKYDLNPIDFSLTYFINDGSLPEPGLKFRTSNLYEWDLPSYGDMCAITGIVQLEGIAPNATPVLCPRRGTDIVRITE